MVGQVLLESIHHLPQPMLMALTSIPAASVHHMTKTIASVVSPSAVWYTSLGFVRSGNVALNTGAMRNFGIHGYGWSRIAIVLLLFTGLVPGMLKLTASTSMLQVLPRPVTMFVGTVSPSAVW